MKYLVAALLICPSALAQTPPCFALNDQTTNSAPGITGFGFAGPTTWGYEFIPPTTINVDAAAIFTTNGILDYSMSLEIWSNNTVTALPMSRMAGGTLEIPRHLGIDWLGTNLDQTVTLQGGSPYWLVWIEPGGFDVPHEPNGITVPTARYSGGAWTPQTSQALKMRLFCNLLDGQGVTVIGDGCPGSLGTIGRLQTNDIPRAGNVDFEVEGTNFSPGSACALYIGILPNFSVPIGGTQGCLLYSEGLASLGNAIGTSDLRSVLASGNVSFDLPIPTTPQGAAANVQLIALDPGLAPSLPVVTSNGLWLAMQ